ncbi:CIA30 family protein [Gymnodinialimonas hymeniacidonis]|uniref:CIA30 family protein n=1 Tax=Gymnodinialimonas hymeniacidonis TaxID=3126508 RepID=UPI0034C6231A
MEWTLATRKAFRAGLFGLALWSVFGMGQAMAQVWDAFDAGADSRWDYVADGVMGGVSEGGAVLEDGAIALRGQVSTANNGGFIQVRRRFEGGWPEQTEGLRLTVRGNGETYYVFLRITGLTRVWHSYRASFTAGADWTEISLPFAEFTPSHAGMAPRFTPDQVISIGLVAYGRDHEAELMVREIGLY